MTIVSPMQIKTGLRVSRPVADVFEAIVDPGKMCNYFISKGSGRMEENTSVEWGFPEMEATFPVAVKKVEKDKLVCFSWNDVDGTATLVEIQLQPVDKTTTFVTVTEGERNADENGIRWLKSNTEGWANFLACLKAYMEFGINLRRGAFDPSQMPV